MDLWFSATSRDAYEFLKGFKRTGEQLAYNLRVVPHYAIFSLPSGHDYDNMCTSSDGKYCAEDPDGSDNVTGKAVAIEQVFCYKFLFSMETARHSSLPDTNL